MSIRSFVVKAVSQALGINNDPNFSAGMQFFTPGQPIFSDKDYRTFMRDGYKRNPTVYACINKISGAAAGIQWKLFTDRDMKKTIDKHPLLDLWRKPNPSVPGTGSFVEQTFGYWHIAGNNYTWAFRPNPNQPPLALWNLRPDRMKAVAGTRGIENYVYGYESNNPQIYQLPDICHIKFAGYDDDVYGLSPIQVASYFADQQNEAMAWNTALMQNAGRPASVFMSKGILTPEQRNQIREEVRKKYSGKRNAGRPLFLEADMTWQNISLTPMELDFLKSFELSTRQICAILDIAPELVGDSAGKTFANVSEARVALYLENVLPKLDRMSDYYNSWLVPMYPDLASSGAYFTYDRKDIEALQALYAAQEKAKRDVARADFMAGLITWNEYRDIAGFDQIKKDGDFIRLGSVLVSLDSLADYADQSLTEPANPPMPLPEPLNVPQPALPGNGKQPPALPAPGQSGNTQRTNNGQKPPTNPKNPTLTPKPGKKPAKANYHIEEVKYFDDSGIYQPDDIETQLAEALAQGYTHGTWICKQAACDECLQNNGVTVEIGKPFPSGVLGKPQHPNCDCDIVYSTQSKARYDLMQHKIQAQLRQAIEGYKVHDGNTYTAVKVSSHLAANENGSSQMLLQFMPLQSRSGSQETPNGEEAAQTTSDTLKTSGDVYRAFIGRYN